MRHVPQPEPVAGPYRAYSSLMIFSTRLIMFPTVVSDGWAAIILLPSLRIISIRSPERRLFWWKEINKWHNTNNNRNAIVFTE